MKKALLSFICAFFALSAYGAYDFQSGGLYYTITSTTNMTVKVSYNSNDKYTGGVYVIPPYVTYKDQRYYVTAIGSYAFSGCTNLTTIIFDDNTYVKTIGDYAFSGCNAMSSITIPASVTSIGDYVFSACFTLQHVTIEDATSTLSLGHGSKNGSNYGLFADTDLRSFYWGRQLDYNTNYGRSPIANLPNLSEITIGPNVSTISAYMFYGNTALSTITLPETVTTLGDHAFHGWKNLTSFTIPSHITSIETYAFAGCTGLTSITIPEQITSIKDGTFSGCTGLKSFVVPNSVMSIGNYAFNGCTSMTGVVFEESEETLKLGYNTYNSDGTGKGMFYDCPLQSAFIGRPLNYSYYSVNTVKYNDYPSRFGYSPFANNATLTKVHFGNPVKAIQLYMFYGCKELTTFEYNANCKPTAIENYVFAGGCKGLTNFDIPATVTTIGAGAFKDCEKLENIVIKPSVTNISNYAFNGCTSMTGVVFEESEETLKLGYNTYNSDGTGKGMFYDCPLQSVFIGRPLNYSYYSVNTVKYSDYPGRFGYSPFANNATITKAHFGNPVKAIQLYLFAGCTSLTTLQYNSNCKPTIIEKYAFWSCRSLTETDIVYPESVNTIGDGAFRYCTSLEGYTIPNHITTVGNYAFQNCEKLASVVVKPSVTSIGNGAFNGCTSMTGVVFEESEETLKLGYNTYNSDGVGKGMFYDCPLQSAFIGRPLNYSYYSVNTVKYNDYPSRFGYSPFANNATLTEAHLGNPVKAMQLYLFYGCKELTTLEYDADFKPTAIEKYAFAGGCKGLTSIDIPATVTSVGDYAFQNCTSLTDVSCHPVKVPTTKTNAFNGVSVEEVTLHVPATSVNSYKATEPWKNFIIEGMADDAKGDVNGDGDVDIADAVCIVNYVVGKPNTTFIEAAADANGDGDIDIADAVHIVNLVVGKISALAPRFEWNIPEPE